MTLSVFVITYVFYILGWIAAGVMLAVAWGLAAAQGEWKNPVLWVATSIVILLVLASSS